MSFNQTRDLLDHAQDFHRRLCQFYETLLDRASEQKTRELLYSLIEHENVLNQRMQEYEEEVSANILDTFFKYVVDGSETHFAQYHIPSAVDTHYVITAARHFDDCLTTFYKEMARKALSEQVREVLLNLMDMEQREQMRLSKQELELFHVLGEKKPPRAAQE